jgi:hypothetical protein
MRKNLSVITVLFILASCNNSDTANKDKLTIAPDSAVHATNLNMSHEVVSRDSIAKEKIINPRANKILGTWALVGMDNASFVIETKKIMYPETFSSYNYSHVGDSLKIKYDDYEGNFLLKMKGSDTLMLVGDEEQVYYRMKK